MITDRFIKQGSTHEICEDYAFCFEDRVVLCDGCSSSENTDVGARLLALTPEDRLESVYHQYRGVLGDTFMDATKLEAVREDYNNKVSIKIKGDGYFICFADKEKEYVAVELQFSSGAPLYPSYSFSASRLTSYKKEFEGSFVRENSWGGNEKDTIPVQFYENILPIQNYNYYGSFTFGDSVLLASDGLASFTSKQGDILPVKKVIEDMMKFKNYTPRFLQRRMKALCKEYAKEGYVNTDDVSVVVMSFMDEV